MHEHLTASVEVVEAGDLLPAPMLAFSSFTSPAGEFRASTCFPHVANVDAQKAATEFESSLTAFINEKHRA
jgi:hypothetical protein